jgi:hypothetical protein
MQRPTHAGAALAWRTGLAFRAILLLALRWGLGRIVRRLRWPGQFIESRLKCRDAGVLGRDPLVRRGKSGQQRQDQRILLSMAQPGEIGWLDHPAVRIDSTVTVSSVRQSPRIAG